MIDYHVIADVTDVEQLKGRICALKDALALSESRNDFLNSEIDRLKEEIEKLKRRVDAR
jgi:peptidoglycan hydrolase CwlO-like protein